MSQAIQPVRAVAGPLASTTSERSHSFSSALAVARAQARHLSVGCITITADEAAQMLGLSRCTVYECIRRGEIPAHRFGRRLVIVRDELDALLNEHGLGLDTRNGS